MAERNAPSWEQVRDDLEATWNATEEGWKNPWNEVEPAVRLGYEQGLGLGQIGVEWDDVKDQIESEWSDNVPHPGWETWGEAQDAAKLGFDRAVQELNQRRTA